MGSEMCIRDRVGEWRLWGCVSRQSTHEHAGWALFFLQLDGEPIGISISSFAVGGSTNRQAQSSVSPRDPGEGPESGRHPKHYQRLLTQRRLPGASTGPVAGPTAQPLTHSSNPCLTMAHAVISCLHANLAAFQAVLDDIDQQGIKTITCLGDLVGYGPQPNEAVSYTHLTLPTKRIV